MANYPYRMPPLPDWSLLDDLGGLVPSQVRSELIKYGKSSVENFAASTQIPNVGEYLSSVHNSVEKWQDATRNSVRPEVAPYLEERELEIIGSKYMLSEIQNLRNLVSNIVRKNIELIRVNEECKLQERRLEEALLRTKTSE